jgi:hypothetical protein
MGNMALPGVIGMGTMPNSSSGSRSLPLCMLGNDSSSSESISSTGSGQKSIECSDTKTHVTYTILIHKSDFGLVRRGKTYKRMTERTKEPLACSQYPTFDLSFVTLQLCVMYHGGPKFGCAGSMVSGDV